MEQRKSTTTTTTTTTKKPKPSPEELKARKKKQATRNFGKKLAGISSYDLFWFAFGIFILRVVWFLSTNGLPHKPSKK
jgi:hypothetical protein